MTGKQSRQIARFAENVALISLLNHVPCLPSENDTPVNHDVGRVLSFERERTLASVFAFLAGVSNDPNHVVALCIEERPDRAGLKILLAINKSKPSDSEKLLQTIKNGLQDILDLLSKAGAETGRALELEVFQAVIRLCRKRVLQRISSGRLGHESKFKKPAYLGDTMRSVTDVLIKQKQRGDTEPASIPMVEWFLAISKRLSPLLQELESCHEKNIDQIIEQVLTTASQLNKFESSLSTFLSRVPGQELNPSTSKGLVRRLAKLGQYHRYSRYLFKTAKTTDLFGHAMVLTAGLNADLFAKAPISSDIISLGDCLDRCQPLPKASKARLFQQLDITASKADAGFTVAAKKVILESRIHAEIQLLTHYELKRVRLPPRIICSNKDACYLCNETTKLHGQFKIPKSHGRLYTAWNLPALPAHKNLRSRLNLELESRIGSLCRDILASPRRRVFMHPNESTVFPLSASMTTLQSVPGSLSRLPIIAAALSTSEDQHDERSMQTVRLLSSPKRSLQTIIERPASLATPETSTGSVSSDEREEKKVESTTQQAQIPSILVCPDGVDEATACQPHGEERGQNRDDQGTGPSLSDTGSDVPDESVTPRKNDKGKGKAIDYGGSRADIPLSGEDLSLELPIQLSQGVAVNCRMIGDQWPRCFVAGKLSLYPEFLGRKRSKNSDSLELQVEWLGEEEATKVNCAVMDVETMEGAVDVDSGSPDHVILRYGHDNVRIIVIRS